MCRFDGIILVNIKAIKNGQYLSTVAIVDWRKNIANKRIADCGIADYCYVSHSFCMVAYYYKN